MSWPFGSRPRTYVDTSVSRLVPVKALSDLGLTSTIKAILRNDSVGETLIDDVIKGIGFKSERAFDWAKDNYTYGLPNHTFMSDAVGLQEMIAVLEGIHGGSVDVTYHHFSALNQVHVGYKQLLDTYEYDEFSNTLGTLTTELGFPVYVESVVGVINKDVTQFEDPQETVLNPFVNPDPNDMITWGVAPNRRYTPWTNPYYEEPSWAFSEDNVSTVVLYYAYMSTVPVVGSGSETLLAAFQVQAAADIAAYEAGIIADPPTVTYADNPLLTATLEEVYIRELQVATPEDFIYRETVDLGLAGLDIEKAYFHTRYNYDLSNPGGPATGYFTYEYGAGTYAALDAIADASNAPAEFMPIIFFRHNRQNMTAPAEQNTAEYLSTDKLMYRLGMDYQQIGDDIHENPDAGTVEEAVLMYGVPVDATEPLAVQYLYEFFYWLYLNEGSQTSELGGLLDFSLTAGVQTTDTGILGLTENARSVTISDGEFRMQLNYSAVASVAVSGTLFEDPGTNLIPARIGFTQSALETEVVSYDVYLTYSMEDKEVINIVTLEKDILIYVFKKQISPNLYREVRVSGLHMFYRVDGLDVFINTDDVAGRLIIPLNHDLVKEHFNVIEKDRLYGFSLHMIFNSKITVKLAWYETEAFAAILAVVAVAVIVFTAGTTSAAVAETYLALVSTVGVVAAAVLTGLYYIAINLVIQEAFSFIAEKVGFEAALILAVIAFMAGVVAPDGTDPTWSKNLLAISSNLARAGTTQLTTETNEYLLESAAFKLLEEEKLAELKEIEKLLDNPISLNPLELIGQVPMFISGEKPSDFFNRTIHAGNIGTLTYTSVEQYVDIALTLPAH